MRTKNIIYGYILLKSFDKIFSKFMFVTNGRELYEQLNKYSKEIDKYNLKYLRKKLYILFEWILIEIKMDTIIIS